MVWLVCLPSVAVVVATATPWILPLTVALTLLLLWFPVAWSLRRVVVTATSVTEVRFWPIRRSWPCTDIEQVRLAAWELGVIGLPATRVEMRVDGREVWLPTLQAWALTRASRQRALARVVSLSHVAGAAWSDATHQ